MRAIHPSVRKPLALFVLLLALSAIAFSNAAAQAKPDTIKHRTFRPRAAQLHARRVVDTAWVASKRGTTYYLIGCAGSKALVRANVITFKTESEAKAAGFTRSKARGC